MTDRVSKIKQRPDILSLACAIIFWPWAILSGSYLFDFTNGMFEDDTKLTSIIFEWSVVAIMILPFIFGFIITLWSIIWRQGKLWLAIVGLSLHTINLIISWIIVQVSLSV